MRSTILSSSALRSAGLTVGVVGAEVSVGVGAEPELDPELELELERGPSSGARRMVGASPGLGLCGSGADPPDWRNRSAVRSASERRMLLSPEDATAGTGGGPPDPDASDAEDAEPVARATAWAMLADAPPAATGRPRAPMVAASVVAPPAVVGMDTGGRTDRINWPVR